MRIGINATCLNDRPSGARQRFIGLYREVFQLCSSDEFVVYEPHDCRVREWFGGPRNVRFRRTPLLSEARLQRGVVGAVYWPTVARQDRLDLLECSHLPSVQLRGTKTILTIHDVRGTRDKQGGLRGHVYEAVLRRGVSRAACVVTVSHAMRDELLRFRPGTDVRVIYNGVNKGFATPVDAKVVETVRAKFNLARDFILAVGHLEPRKNYAALVDALARLHASGRQVTLVIVGNDSGSRGEVLERVRRHGLEKWVRLVEGASDDELRGLYSLAAVLAFPSTYEGFGIPILEAMATGLAMALSDTAVFRELTQGNASYFSPTDSDAMAISLEHLLASDVVRERQRVSGFARLKDFEYETLAAQVVSLYRELAGHR